MWSSTSTCQLCQKKRNAVQGHDASTGWCPVHRKYVLTPMLQEQRTMRRRGKEVTAGCQLHPQRACIEGVHSLPPPTHPPPDAGTIPQQQLTARSTPASVHNVSQSDASRISTTTATSKTVSMIPQTCNSATTQMRNQVASSLLAWLILTVACRHFQPGRRTYMLRRSARENPMISWSKAQTQCMSYQEKIFTKSFPRMESKI